MIKICSKLLFAHCMMSHLSWRVGMGGIRELLGGKIWERDLSFRWEWEWDGNGNELIKMGGNWYEKSVPAHLYSAGTTGSVMSTAELTRLSTQTCLIY